jgi:hypothetical protein
MKLIIAYASGDSLTNSSPMLANYALDSRKQRVVQYPSSHQTKVLHNLFALGERLR